MARRLQQTMADYVVIAISPALIMALVGSLTFFLIEVFYQGHFEARLHWVMACFVFAAVLIGRISIEQGFERAAPFGIALALVVGLAVMRFVDVRGAAIGALGNLVNWGLIGLIWWCTHRLTWDCTLVDDSQDASGQGLLETTGLDRSTGADPDSAESGEAKGQTMSYEDAVAGTTSRSNVPVGWWQRYLDRQRRPHAPGVWVVYFSLAALPIFGIGQWFIPASNLAARRYAFWLLCVYVASGLGLLLTTSFLALRRYLRQRRIEMPTTMANLWLAIGAMMIASLLVVAMLLPRPSAEYAISELPFTVGSPDQHASHAPAVPKEGAQDEQPGTAPDDRTQQDNHPAESHEQQPAERPTDTSSGNGGEKSSPAQQPAGQPSSSGPQNQNQSQSSGSTSQSGGATKSGQSDAGRGSGSSAAKGQRSAKGESKNQDSRQTPRGQNEPVNSPDKSRGARSGAERAQRSDKSKRGEADRAQSQNSPLAKAAERQQAEPTQQPPSDPAKPSPAPEVAEPAAGALAAVSSALGGLAGALKWLFYGAVVLAALVAMWRFRAAVLASIRRFLAGLAEWFGALTGRKRPGLAVSADLPPEFPPAPFSTYADPFASGVASRYSLVELVRYSFEAFEAWSREHGCVREPDQTPHELARDVARLNAPIAQDARNVAELYSLAAYARGDLPAATAEQLRRLWEQMRATAGSLS